MVILQAFSHLYSWRLLLGFGVVPAVIIIYLRRGVPESPRWLAQNGHAEEAKAVGDRVFGRAAFVGEIVWVPGNGAKARRGPGTSHQTLLIYAAGDDYVWNARDPALRAPYAKTSLAMHFTNKDFTVEG